MYKEEVILFTNIASVSTDMQTREWLEMERDQGRGGGMREQGE